MLENSKNTLIDTFNSIKKLIFIFDLIFQFTYIGYLVLQIIFENGILIANSLLLGISGIYLIYYLITMQEFYTMKESKNRKRTKNITRISKRLVNIAIITIAIVELSLHQTNQDNAKILMTSLMIVGFIFSIMFDAINAFIDKRVDIIKSAAFADIEDFREKHPKLASAISKEKLRIDSNMRKKLDDIKHNVDSKSKRKAHFEAKK